MTKIKFNNTEFEVTSFNKNSYFNDNNMNSNASCEIRVENTSDLTALTKTTITSIQITYDEELIYDLQDISAKINNINEYLSTDHMNTSISLTFDNE